MITPDRWFHTGDTAVIQENGYGRIVGRMKDMIIRGGENIYPREVEEFLHTHPAVREAQVIRRRDTFPFPVQKRFVCLILKSGNMLGRHLACRMRGWVRSCAPG